MENKGTKLIELMKRSMHNSGNAKKIQSGIGITIVAVFALSSMIVSQSVQALNQLAGNYGYYNGAYGYNASTTSSDDIPRAPTALVCNDTVPTVACTWTAPTLTVKGTAIATGGGSVASYNIGISTTSISSCSSGTTFTSTSASKTFTDKSAGTTHFVAICAVDNNGNAGVPLTGSFTTSSSGSSSSSSSGGGTSGGVSSGQLTAPAATKPPASVTAPTPAPSVADIKQLLSEAKVVSNVQGLLNALGILTRNQASETAQQKKIAQILGKITDAATAQTLINFVTYGTPATVSLGSGERLGVLNSYKAAFGRVPSTEAELSDALKIATGRWPSEKSEKAETKAAAAFKVIYKRVANMTQANDNAAVTVMAYGLRPALRNTNSEKAAVAIFRAIFKKAPTLATDWDLVRAISYSGAKR